MYLTFSVANVLIFVYPTLCTFLRQIILGKCARIEKRATPPEKHKQYVLPVLPICHHLDHIPKFPDWIKKSA